MGRNYSSAMEQLRCKKHPSHKQSKGVCPSCLREKLSHLSAASSSSSSSSAANHSNSSTYSSLSPCSDDSNLSSSLGSPPPLHKMAKNRSFSFRLMRSSNKPLMKKSRSLAFVVEEKKGEEEEEEKKKKKKGFWSKLSLGKRKEEEDIGGMVHSKTMKERFSTKWVLFS